MRSVDRGPEPTRLTTSGGTQKKLFASYGDLRIDLISRLGEYCSYCEVPLGVNLAVEHMLSKVFSINEIDWNNSLLACTNCNSHKKDKTLDEDHLNDYYWPSLKYDNNFNTFDMLQYGKASMTPQTLINEGVLEVPQNRRSAAFLNTANDMVWARVNPTYAGRPPVPWIQRTINLTALNVFIADDDKVADRRVLNRTAAWDRAVMAATHLANYFQPFNVQYNAAAGNAVLQAQVIANAGNDPDIKLLKNQIKALAVATGFWSVWITIFKQTTRTFINNQVRSNLICELFIKTFPGTRLPYIGIASCPA